ncbi:hypothetical protein [Caulobacter sp. 1776]|uniref:hypothetical protein n=1 Tax=Caulobacter sp. 1776 TaxID=3156420 RepID=UPI00339AB0B2
MDTAPRDGKSVSLIDADGQRVERAWWTLCDAPERGVLGVFAWANTPKGYRPIGWRPWTRPGDG